MADLKLQQTIELIALMEQAVKPSDAVHTLYQAQKQCRLIPKVESEKSASMGKEYEKDLVDKGLVNYLSIWRVFKETFKRTIDAL